ncbi:hypothetical protein HWV62_43545 [Athelia sp. TMB]|nr:hypothetical protein HWV62_43545 [Athelia sp. TMB]
MSKRSLVKAVTPEPEYGAADTSISNPSKTRAKPSDRTSSEAKAGAQDADSNKSPATPAKPSIVFTDEEDFVSVALTEQPDGEHTQDKDDMPELVDVSASEYSDDDSFIASEDGEEEVSDDGDFVVSGEDNNEEEGGEEKFEMVEPAPDPARDEPAKNLPVNRKQRTKVEDTLDKMETERDMYAAARAKSLASIASTNPGDGTKRLYGEDTYVHDDIQDRPIGPRGRPRVPAPIAPTKTRRQRKGVSKKAMEGEDMVLLSDSDPRGEIGPAECQVANPDDMDPIINYKGLAPLFGNRRIGSWSSLPGPGLAVPSAWHEENPEMSMSQFRNCIQFKNHEYFYNPSRMTPSEMGLSPHPGNSYIVPGGTTKPATLTTAILVTSSNLHRMKEVFGEDRRMITGIPHMTEWQRMEAAILMTMHLETAHAQLAQQAITFSTSRTMGAGSTSPAKNPSRMFRQPAGAPSSRGSPFTSPLHNIQGSGYG